MAAYTTAVNKALKQKLDVQHGIFQGEKIRHSAGGHQKPPAGDKPLRFYLSGGARRSGIIDDGIVMPVAVFDDLHLNRLHHFAQGIEFDSAR